MHKSNTKHELNLICETGIGFSQRDANVKEEEKKGSISFQVIKNDGTPENLRYLTDLKNIISKQLPKMPKEYIVRLVFDKKHESMVIIQSKLKYFLIFYFNFRSKRKHQKSPRRCML
ncbi:MAG: hypothetical protein MJ252_16015 [archaeon]|nr:hypothetical protein [archaeon]